MKKYEAPMVELTKFDVEDVITVSATNPNLDTAAAATDIANYAAANAGSTEDSFDGVFSW